MLKFVARENIVKLEKLLVGEGDTARRQLLTSLVDSERANLRSMDGRLEAPPRSERP